MQIAWTLVNPFVQQITYALHVKIILIVNWATFAATETACPAALMMTVVLAVIHASTMCALTQSVALTLSMQTAETLRNRYVRMITPVLLDAEGRKIAKATTRSVMAPTVTVNSATNSATNVNRAVTITTTVMAFTVI